MQLYPWKEAGKEGSLTSSVGKNQQRYFFSKIMLAEQPEEWGLRLYGGLQMVELF